MQMLRCGVIGVGYFGKHYVRLIPQLDGATLVATANQQTEAQKLCERPDVDAVVIATPATTHCQLVQSALAAGKHVLVEKPMALNVADARALQQAVQTSRCVLMVGHQYLYHDAILHLKKQIDAGRLGKIRYLYAEHLYCGPIRNDIGAFWDAATHELSVIDYLFGPCEIVDAKGSKLAIANSGRDDFAACTATFSNNLLLTLVTSRFAAQKVRRMFFGGTAGLAVFDDVQNSEKLKFVLQPFPAEPMTGTRSRFFALAPEQTVVPEIARREPLRNELEHFITCIRHGGTPRTDIAHGLRVTEWLEYIYQRLTPTK